MDDVVAVKYIKKTVGVRKVTNTGRTAAIYLGHNYRELIGKHVIVELLVPINELDVVDANEVERGDK